MSKFSEIEQIQINSDKYTRTNVKAQIREMTTIREMDVGWGCGDGMSWRWPITATGVARGAVWGCGWCMGVDNPPTRVMGHLWAIVWDEPSHTSEQQKTPTPRDVGVEPPFGVYHGFFKSSGTSPASNAAACFGVIGSRKLIVPCFGNSAFFHAMTRATLSASYRHSTRNSNGG